MQIFSPDGKYGYVCSSSTPETVVITVVDHKIVGRIQQLSPFCPNIAVTPDGKQVWFTLKDIGKTQVFDANPPFSVLKTINTGPITNHVNIVHNAKGTFAYVTVGGLNEVQVFRTDNFSKVATIPVGKLPHGIWPSGDGTLIYVGLENGDRLVAIDTLNNKLIASSPIGQASQAIVYVPDAVPNGNGTQGLQPLGVNGLATHLSLVPRDYDKVMNDTNAPTSISLFDQPSGIDIQAELQDLSQYIPTCSRYHTISMAVYSGTTAAIPDPSGWICHRQHNRADPTTRTGQRLPLYLVIVPGTANQHGSPVHIQLINGQSIS